MVDDTHAHDVPEPHSSRTLQLALELVGKGYFVAPVIIRRDARTGKKLGDYLGIRWHDQSTDDPDQVLDWFAQYGDQLSYLVDTGRSGVFVVDLDVTPEATGEAVWNAANLPLGGMIVRTPGGGYHHWFRQPPGESLTVHKRIHGHPIDVRADGGHVYAPGAKVLGPLGEPELRGYEVIGAIVAPEALAVLPTIVREFLKAAKTSARRRPEAQGEVRMHGWVVETCGRQLEKVKTAERREGSGFRAALLGASLVLGRAVAGGLLTEAQATRRLEKAAAMVWGRVDADDRRWIRHGIEDGMSDPWTIVPDDWDTEVPKSITSGVGSASAVTDGDKARSEPAGTFNISNADGETVDARTGEAVDVLTDPEPAAEPVDQLSELEDSPEAVAARRRARLFSEELERQEIRDAARLELARRKRANRPSIADGVVDDLDDVPEPVMLMASLIPDDSVGFVNGRSGAYKSFLATAWACCIATGTAWLGRPEFVVLEPRKTLYVAAEGRNGAAGRIRAWEKATGISRAGKLLLYGRPIHLNDPVQVAELSDYVRESGIRFLVIDTYHRSAPGVEENSSTEFGVVFEAAARLRDDHGCSVLFVDHTGHGGERSRGTSAKDDDADYTLHAGYDGMTRGPDVQRHLEVRKLKDDSSTGSWDISLRSVDGEKFPVVVVDSTDAGSLVPPAEWWLDAPAVPQDIHDALVKVSDNGRGVEHARWIWRALVVLSSSGEGFTRSELERFLKGSPAEARGLSASILQRAIKLLDRSGIAVRDGVRLQLNPSARPRP